MRAYIQCTTFKSVNDMGLNHLQLVTDFNVEHCRLCVGLEALTFPKGSFKVQIQKVVFGLHTFFLHFGNNQSFISTKPLR